MDFVEMLLFTLALLGLTASVLTMPELYHLIRVLCFSWRIRKDTKSKRKSKRKPKKKRTLRKTKYLYY